MIELATLNEQKKITRKNNEEINNLWMTRKFCDSNRDDHDDDDDGEGW